ncbi:response regulator [Erythrobacter sp. SD-21]|uniref:response regulator n=1 Tax=Erythrobacter sp. SD-21 TaxID=161528 RepID=UPI000153F9A4|nr:response regulator [Erythrobacter sp. SD-21]EDL48614.1 two-component response regulator [Erythrobacter sp. SD-21]
MKRIMVVDDEALVLFDLVMTVEDLGYEVFCDSISVPDALECLGDDCPDAALLDIDVGGTLVWPLARVLKERGCPIAFVSANGAHQELKGEFADAGFIDKPASSDQIGMTLERLLGTAQVEPQAIAARA